MVKELNKKKFEKLGINVIYFIIEENLNNMSFMFNECSSLKEINFVNIETIQVTKMKVIFQLCTELERLDLSNFNTSNVTDMGWMFNECHKLKEIKGINNFITINATNMEGMFADCNELVNLDLSNFNTYRVAVMGSMFYECYKLKEIKGIYNFRINFRITDMISSFEMFDECNDLEYIDISKFNSDSRLISKIINRKLIKGN